MSETINLIIADDHPIVRQGLRQTIEREPDLRIVSEAGDGETAFQNIIALQPDIAVLDVDMPKRSGFEVLKAISEARKTRVIILTVHNEEDFFNEALRRGAKGYVLKDSAIEDIVTAIRAVAAGQNYVSPALTSYLFKQNHNAAADSDATQLTPTERKILSLIAAYKTNNQIAEELFISPHTVKTHRKNICAKLNLEGNHALMRFALENQNRF